MNNSPSTEKKILLIILGFSGLATIGIVSKTLFTVDQLEQPKQTEKAIKESPPPAPDFSHELRSLKSLKTEKPKPDFSSLSSAEYRVNEYSTYKNQIYILKGSGIDSLVEMAGMYEKLLIDMQNKEFPILRKTAGKKLGDELWIDDMAVQVSGNRNTTITFIGGKFAANRNIVDFHNGIESRLLRMRFKRVNYKWIRGSSEYSYYTLDPSPDNQME